MESVLFVKANARVEVEILALNEVKGFPWLLVSQVMAGTYTIPKRSLGTIYEANKAITRKNLM